MEVFIQNRETGERFTMRYFSDAIEWGSGETRYAAADTPLVAVPAQYWLGTASRARSIVCILEGDDTQDRLAEVERLKQVNATTFAPPVCWLQIGALTPVLIVITNVNFSLPIDRFRGDKPTRARVSISYLEVSEGAIA